MPRSGKAASSERKEDSAPGFAEPGSFRERSRPDPEQSRSITRLHGGRKNVLRSPLDFFRLCGILWLVSANFRPRPAFNQNGFLGVHRRLFLGKRLAKANRCMLIYIRPRSAKADRKPGGAGVKAAATLADRTLVPGTRNFRPVRQDHCPGTVGARRYFR